MGLDPDLKLRPAVCALGGSGGESGERAKLTPALRALDVDRTPNTLDAGHGQRPFVLVGSTSL